MWFFYAFIAALSDGFKSIVDRIVLKTQSPFAYALVENFLAAAAFIPLLAREFSFPRAGLPWLLVLLASVLWALIAIVGFTATKFTPVSLKDPINQSRLIFVFILSVIFLSESVTAAKLLGTLIIFIGVVILTYRHRQMFGALSDKGVQLTLLVAALAAVVTIVDKTAIQYFTPGTYGFLVYFIPALMLSAFLHPRRAETITLIKTMGGYLAVGMILAVGFYYFNLKALSLAQASLVFPIVRLSTLVRVIGGIAVFKEERTHIGRKLVAGALVIIGALLLSGKYFA